MVRPLAKVFVLLSVISCCSMVASADSVGVGFLSFDLGTLTDLSSTAFDITNLTGGNADTVDDPSPFPITTQLTFTITSLVANVQGGGTITIGAGDFTSDAAGDLTCSVDGDAKTSGGCNFAAYDLVSATLTGTLSPLTGLAGLPGGDNSILSTFTTTIIPTADPCGVPGDPGHDPDCRLRWRNH